MELTATQWRTQRGGYGGSNPPIESIESSKKFCTVCLQTIYSPFPALVFIKSNILYRKTLEIVC